MTGRRLAGKPFDIPKTLVWEAYQKVKANKGAAGVDGQSLAEFEQDEKNNLYKLWNRLSVKGQQHFPVGGQLISLLADRLSPCPRSADLLLI
jgi:retron-type reverse transcriptase